MYRIIDCLTHEHHYGLLSVAVISCVVGSSLTVVLLRRMLRAGGRRMWFLWGLSSLIGGTTIWSTHFLAMLAYDPGVEHAYDFKLTLLSLVVAAVGLCVTGSLMTREKLPGRAVLAGAVFGLTVSAMHYVGMNAFLMPGHVIWEIDRVLWSVAAGAGFGAIAYHRILHPVSRYCWTGGAFFMILSIAAMHFTGMTAFTVFLESSVEVPAKSILDTQFGILVAGVTAALYLIGFTSYGIEINIEQETRGHLRYAAMHDQLTGLPNRLKLVEVMKKTSERLEFNNTYKAAVLSIDLDRFKQVNDMYGHAAGDTVLSQTTQRMLKALQDNEFLARTGGDEFVVIKHSFGRREEVIAMASRLHAAIIEPIELAEAEIVLGASIGMSTTINDGRDLDALLVNSDHAMYRAKLQPDVFFLEFNAEIDRQNHEREILISDLRKVIQNDELELVYQFQNSLSTLEPIGFECLLRWNHPTQGRISPGVFIPLAEETGLIRDIGLWVLRTACQEASKWEHPYSIAVNVAPQQLVQPSFVEHVSDILFETTLPPHRLELEITEASMINDQDNTIRVMHRLKKMGLRIAMDDFGTGYSSLATLQAFPFDKIKIDRSFVSDVHSNEQRAAIVRATLLLGDALGIPILAEGVETERELTFLQEENCTSVQGFYFGKPMSTQELEESMREENAMNAKKAG